MSKITYRLISKQNVNMWHCFHQRPFEKLSNEWGRQIHCENLQEMLDKVLSIITKTFHETSLKSIQYLSG